MTKSINILLIDIVRFKRIHTISTKNQHQHQHQHSIDKDTQHKLDYSTFYSISYCKLYTHFMYLFSFNIFIY